MAYEDEYGSGSRGSRFLKDLGGLAKRTARKVTGQKPPGRTGGGSLADIQRHTNQDYLQGMGVAPGKESGALPGVKREEPASKPHEAPPVM